MATALSVAAKTMVALYDVQNLIRSINQLEKRVERREEATLEKASVLNRVTLLGFTAVEVGLLLAGAKDDTIKTLKRLEFLPRLANLPIQLGISYRENDGTFIGTVEMVETGVVVPLAEFFRVLAEGDFYQEKAYLAKGGERIDRKAKYEGDGDVSFEETKRPVDPEECKQLMDVASRAANNAFRVQTVAQLGMVTLGVTVGSLVTTTVFEQLAAYFETVPAPQVSVNANVPEAHVALGQQDRIDLVALTSIPIPLHNDPVFSAYICPITSAPIRYVVGDPTTNPHVLYEREAILVWLGTNDRSPMSREPLTAAELLPKPAVQAMIDARLRSYTTQFNEYLGQIVHPPVNEGELAAAQIEQPNIVIG